MHASNSMLPPTEIQLLARRKSRLAFVLLLAIFAAYFGFVLLLAFAPNVLAAPFGSTTLGIPFGIGIIIFAWILTGIYTRWANRNYDDAARLLREKEEGGRA